MYVGFPNKTLNLPVLAWLRSCTSHLLNDILATPDGYATTACICREGNRGLCSCVTAEGFTMVPFNFHTHTQAAGRSLFSQGHLSVLEEKLPLKVAISCSHGVPVISVPRPLWVTCGIPMSVGWCFPDERAESASAAGEEQTHIFTDLWGFGVGAPAAFPSQWTSGGDLMKSKSCLTTITCFLLNSWHVPPINKLPRVAGIHDWRGILRIWLGPTLAQQPPIAFWVLFIYSLPSSWKLAGFLGE